MLTMSSIKEAAPLQPIIIIGKRTAPPTIPPNTIIVEEGAHAVLGASSAERWLNCPASVRLSKNIKDAGSDYALEGTAAHGLSERCRRKGVLPEVYLGWTVRVMIGTAAYKDFTVTHEMVDAVREFMDLVNEEEGEDIIEAKVIYDFWVKEGFGTLDAARLRMNRGTITDFKYGKGVQVSAKNNTQMKIYALGLYLGWNWLYDFKVFELQIAQPRTSHFDSWEISVEDLLKWAEEVLAPGARRTEDPNAPIVAGEWCTKHFCRVRNICATRAKYNLGLVVGNVNFENLDAIAEVVAIERHAIDTARDIGADLMSSDQLSKLLPALDGVKAWAKEMEHYALSQLAQGHAIGDWKLVEGRSIRKYVIGTTGEDVAERLGVVEEDCFEPRKLLSPAKIEKKFGKAKCKIVTLGNAEEEVKPLVEKPPGKPKLAPGDDPRPPMTQEVLTKFSNLDLEEEEDE